MTTPHWCREKVMVYYYLLLLQGNKIFTTAVGGGEMFFFDRITILFRQCNNMNITYQQFYFCLS